MYSNDSSRALQITVDWNGLTRLNESIVIEVVRFGSWFQILKKSTNVTSPKALRLLLSAILIPDVGTMNAPAISAQSLVGIVEIGCLFSSSFLTETNQQRSNGKQLNKEFERGTFYIPHAYYSTMVVAIVSGSHHVDRSCRYRLKCTWEGVPTNEPNVCRSA